MRQCPLTCFSPTNLPLPLAPATDVNSKETEISPLGEEDVGGGAGKLTDAECRKLTSSCDRCVEAGCFHCPSIKVLGVQGYTCRDDCGSREPRTSCDSSSAARTVGGVSLLVLLAALLVTV
mmetsp:Transcript_36650/g.89585  ORF Transcript_36650/g.89585 Transcript_36650/m.89585 type:complete len:121 (-) Transcript_36650:786-1148(-)